MECEAESRPLLPFHRPASHKPAATQEMQVQTSETSMWAAVAAIQAVDQTVDTHSMRLLHLEGRMGSAEKKLISCKRTTAETEKQLESKWATLGVLMEKFGQLQRRLENVENLLKNRNFWILRLPPGTKGETPKVPITFDDVSVHFNEQEWGELDELQKDLYKTVMKSNFETLVSLDYAVAKPEILSRMDQGQEVWEQGLGASCGSSAHLDFGTDSPVAPVDVSSWLQQEVEEGPGGNAEPAEEVREVSDGSHVASALAMVDASFSLKEELQEVRFVRGPCSGGELCRSSSLEYRAITVEDRPGPGPQESPYAQEPLFLGEGPSTGTAPFLPWAAAAAANAGHTLHEQHRGRFYGMMQEILSTKREDNNSYINRDRYRTLIEEVKEAKRLRSKKGKHYRRLRRFNVLNVGEEEKLVVPLSPGHMEVMFFVQYEDLFDILHEAHVTIGHGGRTRMLKELSRKYKNVTAEAVMTYLKLCELCQKKQSAPKKGLAARPALRSEVDSHCPFDIIYM